jgi:hypothetical protein
MRIAMTLLVLGAALLAWSLALPPFKDQAGFEARAISMQEGQDDEYQRLREEALTPKYALQDYGLTAIALAAGAFVGARRGLKRLCAPRTRSAFVALSLLAPFLTTVAGVFDLRQAYSRYAFPHWADSMGIALAGALILLIVSLLWAVAHLAFLRSQPSTAIPLALAFSHSANPWLLVVSALTFALTALCLFLGQYWYAAPGMLWLYFYLSLAARRRALRLP